MAGQSTKTRIFISACDPSADVHCANLIKAFEPISCQPANSDDKEQSSLSARQVQWVGVGGRQMAQAGCELLENTVAKAAMIYNAFGQVRSYIKLLKRISAYFADNKVDLVIVCDSPAFNFHVAKAAKKAGVKVMFYVAPQLWAWAPWRIWKLRRLCDKLVCILPFEVEWFVGRKVDATFVGNPLFDGLSIDIENSYKDYSGFDPRNCRIALMPGSRGAEIKTLWPAMQRIGLRLKRKWDGVRFVACAADEEKLGVLIDKEVKGFECEYVTGDAAGVAGGSDFALVASGSATLQVAAAGCPMVIMYQSSVILWHLVGSWLVRTRFLSLVNILAGRELVPEYMPYFRSISPIFSRCVGLLQSKSRLVKMSRELVDLARPLATGTVSQKVAEMAGEMISGR